MKNISETIGNTPLVRLDKISGNSNVTLFAKLEGQNPGGSVKDRVALYMIEQAVRRGELKPGMTILEASSGNMGIALAMVGAQKGYRVQIVMSEAMSRERRLVLRALGADLVLSDRKHGTEGAITKARALAAASPGQYWFADQFNNPDNVEAHYHGLAPELLADLSHPDLLIAGIGTSGTLTGLTKKIREESPATKSIAVIPPGGYRIQGLQNPYHDFRGNILDISLFDETMEVTAEDSFEMARMAAREEGLFAGMSTGAALWAARQKSLLMDSGTIIVISPDRGEKYLSTELFGDGVM